MVKEFCFGAEKNTDIHLTQEKRGLLKILTGLSHVSSET